MSTVCTMPVIHVATMAAAAIGPWQPDGDHHGDKQQGRTAAHRAEASPAPPSEGLADTVLHPGQRVDGYADECQVGWQHERRIERFEQEQRGDTGGSDRRVDAERQPAAAAHDAAQQRRFAVLAVTGDEANGGDVARPPRIMTQVHTKT